MSRKLPLFEDEADPTDLNPERISLDYFSITPTDLLAEEFDRDRLQGGHTLNDNTVLGRQQIPNKAPRKDHK